MNIQDVNYTPKGIKILKESNDEIELEYASTSFLRLWFYAICFPLGLFITLYGLGVLFIDGAEHLSAFVISSMFVWVLSIYLYKSMWTQITINKYFITVKEKQYMIGDSRLTGSELPYGYLMTLHYGRDEIRLPNIRNNGSDVLIYIQNMVNKFKKPSSVSVFEIDDDHLKF